MWPFSSAAVDPALAAAARTAGGAAAMSPVDAARASMGGAAGGGLRAAGGGLRAIASRAALPGAALGFAIEAASPGPQTQADLEARRADLQSRQGLDYAGAFLRNLTGAAVNTAYQGTIAPVARAGGDFIRGLVGGTPPSPASTPAQAAPAMSDNDRLAAAMRAEAERRRNPQPAAAAALAAGPAASGPYAGMSLEQAMRMLPEGASRRTERELLQQMLARPDPRAVRPPSGRDVLAYRADALLQQELQALEQARPGLSQADFARQRGSVLQRYLSALGTNPVNDAVAAAMQEAR
jgi:hypothetical protein